MAAAGNNLELLREAIARRAGVVLSLPDRPLKEGAGSLLRHYKSRFLADAGDGLWVASVPAETQWVQELAARQEPAGVSFRSDHLKVMFTAPVLHLQPDYGVAGPGGPVEALLLRFPSAREVRSVHRRKTYRVPVPAGSDLAAKLWVITEQAQLRDKPPARSELACELFDLSVAGMGAIVRGAGGKPPAVSAGDRVRVLLALRETDVLLEGRLCYPPRPTTHGPGVVRIGVQSRKHGDGRDDRAAAAQLDRIVSQLQRDSIRRKKLGVT